MATEKPAGWGAGGRVVLFMVEVARVELASKYVKYSATTGLVGCCTLRSAGSRRYIAHLVLSQCIFEVLSKAIVIETQFILRKCIPVTLLW